jgi:hypothetical protein
LFLRPRPRFRHEGANSHPDLTRFRSESADVRYNNVRLRHENIDGRYNTVVFRHESADVRYNNVEFGHENEGLRYNTVMFSHEHAGFRYNTAVFSHEHAGVRYNNVGFRYALKRVTAFASGGKAMLSRFARQAVHFGMIRSSPPDLLPMFINVCCFILHRCPTPSVNASFASGIPDTTARCKRANVPPPRRPPTNTSRQYEQ